MDVETVCEGKQKISTVLVMYWQCLMLHMSGSINEDVNPLDLKCM
jgi:hypothetical protein